jgi:hypothetical protein
MPRNCVRYVNKKGEALQNPNVVGQYSRASWPLGTSVSSECISKRQNGGQVSLGQMRKVILASH